MHSAVALAYCNYFLVRDKFVRDCALRATKKLAAAPINQNRARLALRRIGTNPRNCTAPRTTRGRNGSTARVCPWHPLDSRPECSHFVLMPVEAYAAGWSLTVRCAFGKGDTMKRVRECAYRADLDLETLVWTRGRNFPVSRLEGRLMCPRCGSRRVAVLFAIPPNQTRAVIRF
jgi:hypothetical protein